MLSKRALKMFNESFLKPMYNRCLQISGIATIILGSLTQTKAIETKGFWWFGYVLIVIGLIAVFGSIITEYKDAPKIILKVKDKIKKQNITLAERIAQEERQ